MADAACPLNRGDLQADLRDLAEVARIVRGAFFAMLERDHPGALQTLHLTYCSGLTSLPELSGCEARRSERSRRSDKLRLSDRRASVRASSSRQSRGGGRRVSGN